MLPAERAVLAHLEALGRLLPILRSAVIPPLALGARQRDDVSHGEIPIPTLRKNLRDGPGANRAAALPNREASTLFECHGRLQLSGNGRVVTRHDHFDPFRQM